MDHTKADLKARREMAGLTQLDLAKALGVDIRSVKRWEKPDNGYPTAPRDAWDIIDGALAVQRQAVTLALAKVQEIEDAQGGAPEEVDLTYYRSQADYDDFGRDPGPVGVADATARAVAAELEAAGYHVRFRYPQEGATRTPGSRY